MSRTRTRSRAARFAPVALTLLLGSLAGCAAVPKGEEQDLFEDYEGKADSFFRPTQHGELPFGTTTDTELTDDARYHAWDFHLAGAATVSAFTDSLDIDTVLYIYRYDERTERWGRYIAKNDDIDETTLLSRLDLDLDAGRYRALVKGYRPDERGWFDFTLACAGTGCATAPACALPEPWWPEPSGEESCDFHLGYGVNDESESHTVLAAEACSLAGPMGVASARYLAEYYERFGAAAPSMLQVDAQVTSTLVQVTVGNADAIADIDQVSYVFEWWSGPILMVRDALNGRSELSCQTTTETACLERYLDAFMRPDSLDQRSDGIVEVAPGDLAALPSLVRQARELFLADAGIDPAFACVHIEWNVWEDEFIERAGTVTVFHEDGVRGVTYDLQADGYNVTVLRELDLTTGVTQATCRLSSIP